MVRVCLPEMISLRSTATRGFVDAVPDIGRAGRDGGDQFGMALPDSLYINAGVQMEYGRVTPPTRTFSGDQLLLTLAGVRLQLLYTPGETMDAISVWLPDKRVLTPGDDFLRAFPNISPIRGARLRIPENWIASLEKMIELGPEYVRAEPHAARRRWRRCARHTQRVPRRHQVHS